MPARNAKSRARTGARDKKGINNIYKSFGARISIARLVLRLIRNLSRGATSSASVHA